MSFALPSNSKNQLFVFAVLIILTGSLLVWLGQSHHELVVERVGTTLLFYFDDKLLLENQLLNTANQSPEISISLKQPKTSGLLQATDVGLASVIAFGGRSIDDDDANQLKTNKLLFHNLLIDPNRFTSATRAISEGPIFNHQLPLPSSDFRVVIPGSNITEYQLSTSDWSFFFRPIWHLDGVLRVNELDEGIPIIPVNHNLQFMLQLVIEKIGLNLFFAGLFLLTYLILLSIISLVLRSFSKFKVLKINSQGYRHSVLNITASYGSQLEMLMVMSISVISLLVTINLSVNTFESFPHSQDEVSYLLQAKNFASFRLFSQSVAEEIRPFFTHEFTINNGRWFGIFPPGWSLALAVGELTNTTYLVGPLIGFFNCLLVYALSKKMFGAKVAILNLIIFASSPFFLMQTASLFSHNLTLFLYLVFFLSLIKKQYAVVGVTIGLTLLTRPYNAVILVIMLLIYFLLLNPESKFIIYLKKSLIMAVCFMPFLLLFLLYNYSLTDNILTTPQLLYFPGNTVGFGPRGSEWNADFTPLMGVNNVTILFHSLLDTASGLPYWLSIFPLSYLSLLVFAKIRNKFAISGNYLVFLILAIFIQILAYFLYFYHGTLYGPRYWYEVFPLITLLISLGLLVMILSLQSLFKNVPSFLIVVIVCVPLLYISLQNTHAILLTQKGENGMQRPKIPYVNEKAVVLIENKGGWQRYGQYFTLQSPDLSNQIIYGWYSGLDNVGKNKQPISNSLLNKYFPDRDIYLWQPEFNLLSSIVE